MAEELALKKAKINQGKEIDENKLAQGNDDGGFQVLKSLSKIYQYLKIFRHYGEVLMGRSD